uniref:G-protein coupled receptors family 1 profile domain-containing protein n=1 Tax=Esox lucius TaxID=8010 RepID=A0AAY5JW38_ESOLU
CVFTEHEDAQYCFQVGNSSCVKYSLSKYFYITLYIFFSLISVVTVFLNLLVIISISHFKHLHSPTNLLILSLAVSDLLVGLLVIPAMTVAIMEPCWVLGGYFCALLLYTFLCATSSLGNLITVNVQVPSRCFEECYFVKGNIWVDIFALFISMIVPCSIIITLYLKIFVVARSQARKVNSNKVVTVLGVKTEQANKSERKAAKTLSIVVFNYLICWIPIYFVQYIYFGSGNSLSAFICFLPLINSFINPIIYAFFYPWFKVTAKHILTMKLSPFRLIIPNTKVYCFSKIYFED